MTRVSRVCAFALLSACLAAAAAYAQAPALKINLGAWEVTTAVDLGGQLPGIDTSKMTPEQKARAEALAQSRPSQSPRVTKTCITKENFQRGAILSNDDPNMKCTQTFASNTPTLLDTTRTCTGDDGVSRTTRTRMEAASSTGLKAAVTNTSIRNGRTINVNVVLTGKWLGADCSGIKQPGL